MQNTKMSQQNTENKDASGEAGQSSTAAAIVPIHQTGDIFRLDIDCFEEVFDFLPLKDLVSVGKTCKRLQEVAGYCCQQNYSAINAFIREGECIEVFTSGENVNCFIPFVNNIFFDTYEILEIFRSEKTKFVRLKLITLSDLDITSNAIECIKDNLSKVECLRIHDCSIHGDLYETLLKLCVKLKRLVISEVYANDVWMLKNYPKLEYVEFESRERHTRNELLKFFELNPTIRMFATGAKLLRNNKAAMMNGKVKLDDLAIYVDLKDGSQSRRFCEMLNEMYDLGVYKRLHLYFYHSYTKQEMIDELPLLKSLVKLYIGSDFGEPVKVSLPNLIDLQEIHIDVPENIINFEDLPGKFTNLKRVYLKNANSTQLLMSVSRMVNLMKIKVGNLGTGLHFDTNDHILDLVALNKERQKLNEAEKVSLFVENGVYLATKWGMKGTDFSHIVIRRASSHSWNHSFFHLY